MLALWVVPQKLGGGSVVGFGDTRSEEPLQGQSRECASFPFWKELSATLWPLVVERLEIAALLLIGITAYLVVHARRASARATGRSPRCASIRPQFAASITGLFGFLWWLGIAVETQAELRR